MSIQVSLKRINTRDPLFAPSLELMNSSFIEDERRNEDELRTLADNNMIFAFNVIEADGNRAGIITTWNFGKFIYVEHFATEPNLRNKGIGISTLQLLASSSALPIVLEVEPELSSPEAARRISFYERAGFHLWQTPYIQPPYNQGKNSLPMNLMAHNLEETQECTQIVKALLYKHVYKVKSVDFPLPF